MSTDHRVSDDGKVRLMPTRDNCFRLNIGSTGTLLIPAKYMYTVAEILVEQIAADRGAS